jgi:hypothetical protein
VNMVQISLLYLWQDGAYIVLRDKINQILERFTMFLTKYLSKL